MIGSNTLIVKRQDVFDVYKFGGYYNDFSAKDINRFIESKTATKSSVSHLEAFVIAQSTNCTSPLCENYSEFAGDAVIIFDFDSQKEIDSKDFVSDFQFNYPNEVYKLKRRFRSLISRETKKIHSLYEEVEGEVLSLMKQGDSSKLSKYLRNKYELFQTARNLNIEDFNLWFIKRRENLTHLYKVLDFQNKVTTKIYTFTVKGVKWVYEIQSYGSIFAKFID